MLPQGEDAGPRRYYLSEESRSFEETYLELVENVIEIRLHLVCRDNPSVRLAVPDSQDRDHVHVLAPPEILVQS